MDDNKDRFKPDHHSPVAAGDDLIRMAEMMEGLRDHLVGITKFTPVNGDTVKALAYVEECVQELISAKWNYCQEVLAGASERLLDLTETRWMGERVPGYFADMTVSKLRDLQSKSRKIRIPTNPATLIEQLKD